MSLFANLKSNDSVLTSDSLSLSYKEISTTYTLLENDYTINCTTGTFTVTLPATSVVNGYSKIYNIKNTGTGIITIDTTGGALIDADTSITLLQYESLTVQSTSSNWIIL